MAWVKPRTASSSEPPDPANPVAPDSNEAGDFAFMRRVGIAMFVLGSTTLLATLPLPDPDTSDHPAIEIIAGLLALGAVIVWAAKTYRRGLVRLYVIYGILLVSALMAVARPIEATPFFYLWPMLFSAYFFTRREVAIDLAIMWVTLGVALFVFSVDPMKQVLFMGVGVSVTLTAVVVTLLRERLTVVIGQLAQASATDYPTGLLNRRALADRDAHLNGRVFDDPRLDEIPAGLGVELHHDAIWVTLEEVSGFRPQSLKVFSRPPELCFRALQRSLRHPLPSL